MRILKEEYVIITNLNIGNLRKLVVKPGIRLVMPKAVILT